ncbi:cell division protein PerM [Amycolatopsis sp. H20-H5]|uniref:cell division protein PerM n=1 Tax=Amycolatopsis sp. H20-H5 TaxID=3046309 RepID=UPI002DBC1248|nr:DUF6350 family protein [Amycolatopsis sp. H20-H5]MEC3982440.1 DUF6350 family protein [Amycolatopsis sp. H20-H5]
MELLTEPERPQGDPVVGDARPRPEISSATRVRVLLAAALGPLITGYAAVATLLAVVGLTADRSAFSAGGTLLAAGPGWLAVHQVQLEIGGHPLGVLPLLPTLGAVLLVARTAAAAARRLGCESPRQVVPVLAAIAGAHALFGLTIALLSAGSPLVAGPLAGFVVPGVLAGLSAVCGIAVRCGLPAVVREQLDPLAIRGVRAGALGLAALLVCGAAVFTLATALSASTVDDLFEPAFGSSFGLFLLSLGYLPNAVVAALSFATGPGFSIGPLSVDMFSYRGGAVPGVPILAGIPASHASWWPALMLLPALAGALVGWTLRNADEDPGARIRTVAVAGAVVGFGCVLLGTLAGGRLGDGPFDPVSVPVGVASVVSFCWIVIPGAFVAFFAGPHEPAKAPGELEYLKGAESAEDAEGAEGAEAADETEEADAEAVAEDGETAEDAELDAEAEAELALELGDEPEEPEAVDELAEAEAPEVDEDSVESAPEQAEAVTDSTEESGGDGGPEADR